MKTILIPITEHSPLLQSLKLESIGLFNLSLNNRKFPKGYEYINGISESPDKVSNFCYRWKNFNLKSNTWQYHRINLTEKGEQILKDNNIAYEYE